MTRYLVRRLLLALVTLWALTTLGFLLVEAIPGDPARQLAGPTASVRTVEAIRHAYGFDRPAWDRYLSTIERLGHLDLGYSFSRSEAVRSVIARDLGRTLTLTVLAFLGELAIGIPLAVLTVAIPYGLVLARILRTSILEELEKPYVQFALSRGEQMRTVRWHHVLPNALAPLFSLLALDFAGLFATVAVVEVVFSIPGVGAGLFGAIKRLDTSLIIGIALVAGLVVVIVNLLADLAVIAIDPRVRRTTLG